MTPGFWSGLDHLRDDVARHERRAGEVHADDRVPLLLRELLDRARLAVLLHEEPVAQDARVVDEAVEPAHRAVRPLDERAHVGLVRDVELARVDLARTLAECNGLRETGFVDVADGDLRARLDEANREMTAHPAGAARDDDLQVGELHGRGS